MVKQPRSNPRKAERNRNKASDGKRNIVGTRVRRLREKSTPKVTQEDLAGRMAAHNVNLDRTAIHRIESGTRAVSDIELFALAKSLRVEISALFGAA